MKTITIKQPYATLISEKIKPYEFRSWKTNYRGDILIHAGKGKVEEEINKYPNLEFPQSRILAKATLTDCILVTKDTKIEGATIGEYAWKLENITKLYLDKEVLGKLSIWEYKDNILLEYPNLQRKEEAIEFIEEFKKYNSKIFGTGNLDKMYLEYENWLEYTNSNLSKDTIKTNHEPSITYFVIREVDNKIVGMTNIRFSLNDYLLKEGGHIGYCVRPKERQKGCAKEILRLGLFELAKRNVKEVLLTCNKDNIGSSKTILSNGGIKENEVISKDNDIVERYWILT